MKKALAVTLTSSLIVLFISSCTSMGKSISTESSKFKFEAEKRNPAAVDCADSLKSSDIPEGTTIELLQPLNLKKYKVNFGSGIDDFLFELLFINGKMNKVTSVNGTVRRYVSFKLSESSFDRIEDFRTGELRLPFKLVITQVEKPKGLRLWVKLFSEIPSTPWVMRLGNAFEIESLGSWTLGELKESLGSRFRVNCSL